MKGKKDKHARKVARRKLLKSLTKSTQSGYKRGQK